MLRPIRSVLVAAALVATSIFSGAAFAQSQPVRVFAAASLKTALDDVIKGWKDGAAVASYAASSALAKQIEQGAPADLFISADLDWMDYLATRNLVRAESRSNLLGNRLVIVAPKGSAVALDVKAGFPLAEALGGGRLAMGEVRAVPAGKYGKAALETLGVWSSVENSTAQADNVRAALVLVARGEAPLGIVYESDAVAEPGVRVVGIFPPGSHPPIIYPAALLSASASPAAASFLRYLRAPESAAIFRRERFTVLP